MYTHKDLCSWVSYIVMDSIGRDSMHSQYAQTSQVW